MKSIWTANYEGNEIRVENNWRHGEMLFVNNELQDHRLSFTSSDLTGYVKDLNGERKDIKVNISGYFTMKCRLFVDHKHVEVTLVKK